MFLRSLPEGRTRPFVPVCDVFASDADLVVRVELPGVDPAKDVTIEVQDDVLVIRGERSLRKEIDEEDYYLMESSYGLFERRLPVPEGVEGTAISAAYTNGVLEVVLPGAAKAMRAEEPKPEKRTIPITTADAA